MVEVTKLKIGDRNTKILKLPSKMPCGKIIRYAEKNIRMRTLLKYAKYAAIAYSHKTGMPNYSEPSDRSAAKRLTMIVKARVHM